VKITAVCGCGSILKQDGCIHFLFQTDNNPELVEHLVKTLGLIGVPSPVPKKPTRRISFNQQPNFDRSVSSN
jgi:hypothetical protein